MAHKSLSIMKSSIPFTCLFLFQFLSFPFTAKTQCTWNGTAGNWSDGSKWSCGHAPLPAENVVINAGTVTLDVSPTVASFTMSNGTITGAYDLNVNNDLILSAGVLGNTGNVAVSGTCSWSGGTLGSTDGTATGTITITGAATLSTGTLKRLFGKTLQLNSGASYSGIGALSLGYGGVLNVPAGQVFSADVTGNVSWTAFTGGGTWNNAGTFDKQGNGALSIGFVFNNSAAVQVNSGALDLSNGGAHNGSFSIAPAATLEFGGGTHDLSTSTLSSTGSLIVSGGTATMPNNSTHTDVTLSGGTAHFSGNNSMDDLMVSGGTLNLSGSLVVQSLTMTNGTVAGACSITIAGNLSLSAGVLGNTGNVAVSGTCSWAGGTLGSTDGMATGTITVAGAATFTSGSLKRLFAKTLNLNSGASYSGIGALSLGYGGVLNVPGGQVFSADVTGNVSWTAFIGGGTWNNAGIFEKQGTGSLNISFAFDNSGTITGTGTVTFSGTFNNTGLISPGASPGILNLNKTSAGIPVQNLAIELEGPTPGVGGYDQLNNTSGALNLNGGILSVTLLNGYLPDVGTSFVIATGTSRTGTFGTLQLPVDNTRWTVTYNATNVTLTVASSLPVQLVDFQVKREGVVALLNWYAATERNNRGFGIERSIDGHNFENIAFVGSRGDTDTPVSYTFEDATLPSAPNVYYRLRQEDNDGAISYSIIRKVTGRVSFSATLSPNPAVDVVTILADLPRKSTVNISITDLQGRPVYQAPGNLLEAGLQQLQVQVNDIPTGVYLFHLQTDTSIQSVPMIKQ